MTRKYPDLLPWYLRWKLPVERPILMVVGYRGGGKTAYGCGLALKRMKAGRKVYANFRISDPEIGTAGGVFSLVQTLDLADCTVIIDEAQAWASARQWASIPPEVLASWAQSRKRGVEWVFLTQHESRVELVIRQLVEAVVVIERVPWLPRWVPVRWVSWSVLDDLAAVRSGRIAPELVVLRDQWLAAYSTWQEVGVADPKAVKEYMKAIRDGADPDTLTLAVPDRLEPVLVKDRALG